MLELVDVALHQNCMEKQLVGGKWPKQLMIILGGAITFKKAERFNWRTKFQLCNDETKRLAAAAKESVWELLARKQFSKY